MPRQWTCAECEQPERGGVKVDAVCHHCGKLLCASDRIWIHDDAFAVDSRETTAVAAHCKSCKQAHHPRARAVPPPEPVR